MLTPDLRTYLDTIKALSPVPNEELVRSVLFDAGWNDESITDAIRYFREPKNVEASPVQVSDGKVPLDKPVTVEGEVSSQFESLEKSGSLEQGELNKKEAVPIDRANDVFLTSNKTLETPVQGHSSQSMLYPDNSSRLGWLAGDSSIQKDSVPPVPPTPTPVVSAESQVVPVAKSFRVGPPMTDLSRAVSGIAEARMEEESSIGEKQIASLGEQVMQKKTVTDSIPSTSLNKKVISPQSVSPIRPVRSGGVNVDGVRPVPSNPSFSVNRLYVNPTMPSAQASVSTAPSVPVAEMTASRPIGGQNVVPTLRQVPSAKNKKTKLKSGRFVTRVGLIAVLLGAVAAIGYMYISNLGPFASTAGMYQEEVIVQNIVSGFVDSLPAVLTMSYELAYTNRDKQVEPIQAAVFGTSSVFSYLFPGSSFSIFAQPDGRISLSASGYVNPAFESSGIDQNMKVSLVGTYGTDSTTIAGALDLLRSNGILYLLPKKVPVVPPLVILFGDVASLENEWIVLSATSSETIAIDEWVADVTSFMDVFSSQPMLVSFAQALDAEQALFLKKRPSTFTNWKGKGTRYTLGVDLQKIPGVIRRIGNEALTSRDPVFASLSGDFARIAADFEQPTIFSALSYLSRYMTVTVDVDADGIFSGISVQSQVAPLVTEGVFSDKQLQLVASLVVTGSGQRHDIAPPENPLLFEEAMQKVMKMTLEEYELHTRLSTVGLIAQALDTFYQISGRYPVSLDELLRNASQISPLASNEEASVVWKQYAERPLLVALPKTDALGPNFSYAVSSSGTDFSMEYMVSLPPIREEVLWRISEWAYEHKSAETIPAGNGFAWRIVDGINTMTKSMASVEGKVYR